MPSITYLEDNESGRNSTQGGGSLEHKAPEPPLRYELGTEPPIGPGQPPDDQAYQDFMRTRRLVTAAQVMAIVSLIIGGVVLSGAALAVAIVALRRASAHASSARDAVGSSWQLLKRSATIALVVAALALVANIVALIMIYPMVMEALQSGDYGAQLLGAEPQAPSGSTSTWG